VFSRESVAAPADACDAGQAGGSDGSLNCQGYGSSVTVTGTFGFVAAGEVLRDLARREVNQLRSVDSAALC
jgi:tRNA A37 threonylcarbamoyladenosine dehydratase